MGRRTATAVRYLDALLADSNGTPWAIELKDQSVGGGHGSYLRDGIAQAVLYRHFIRSADDLEPWFSLHQLDRKSCRAAFAFPTASPGAVSAIAKLYDLAPRFDVELIQFARPGSVN